MRKQMKKLMYLCGVLLLSLYLLTGCEDRVYTSDTTMEEAADISKDGTDNSAGGKACENQTEDTAGTNAESTDKNVQPSDVIESGQYTSKEEVAAYLNQFGHLPANFITKKEAKKLGWVGKEGNLGEVAPGKSIGGDHFGNFEGMLPVKGGRTYQECDINSDGSYRGKERIIYSSDGLIYYTGDHYESFELLYGEE